MSFDHPIVIVPGAWQTPVAWEGFAAQLREELATTVEYVQMPTVGGLEGPPLTASLADDVAAVQAVLTRLQEQEGAKTPLVLCHSSGGVVSSNAVKGFVVAGIIYLSAFIIPSGNSLLGMLGGQPLPWMVLEVCSPLPAP